MGEFKIIVTGQGKIGNGLACKLDDKLAEKIAKETEYSVIKYNVYNIVDKNEEPVDAKALLHLNKEYNFKFVK